MESSREASEQGVMKEMGLTAQDIERRKKIVGLGAEDLARIGALREVVRRNAEELTAGFFTALGAVDESKGLTGNRAALEDARRQKLEHLLALADGDYGVSYAEQRVRLARLYSRVGLDPRVFLGGFHSLLKNIGIATMRHFEREPMAGFESFMSLEKVAFFDIGIIMDVIAFERERVIRQQQEAIRELSTPVLQIRDRLLLLPIIGVIDTLRARLITESLLRAIRTNRARMVVMDVTGVATIDSKVANHLLQTVSAARLMGANVIVTGLSSDVAQSLVGLGIELAKLDTMGDLQGGLEEAERMLGFRMGRELDARHAGNGAELDAELE
ncbi:MAG TPA: protoglobin domain-containing protein [Labilithrix sp.]